MRPLTFCTITLYFSALSALAHAHDTHSHSQATYLGNEGVMVEHEGTKILFDPFFHNDYGQFQLVPESMLNKIFANQKPYDNIAAIFISHAHEDHFDANQLLRYLSQYPKVKFVGPEQAIEKLNELDGAEALQKQMISLPVKFEGPVERMTIENIDIEGVFLPHAGWPRTKNIENVSYRVTIDNELTVIHMGDADTTASFISQHDSHWQKRQTQTAFPPFWFLADETSFKILDTHLNAEHFIGIHVPKNVPAPLKESGHDYFAQPGEVSDLDHH
jgi:ribonuclease BN (tRNA processing enzyme)